MKESKGGLYSMDNNYENNSINDAFIPTGYNKDTEREQKKDPSVSENEETSVGNKMPIVDINNLDRQLTDDKQDARIEALKNRLDKLEALQKQVPALEQLKEGEARKRLLPFNSNSGWRHGLVHPVLLAIITSLFGIVFVTYVFK